MFVNSVCSGGAMHSHHTRFYLGFNLVSGIGPIRLARLIERCGSVEAAWHADAFDLAASGIDARSAGLLAETRRRIDLDAELGRADQLGVALLTIEDAGYPALLREAPGAPPLLYVRGCLTSADDWSLAVVGTRSPTTYGREACQRLVTDLVGTGLTIVSGLALGIDGIAHTAALDAGGRTIAVLGCGVDLPYPERHRHLAEQIVSNGALISDYPLGAKPAAANFPPRNRIISGLSRGTLVVEAGERSGALITVGFALEQGRDVLAVPGSIFSRRSAGVHRLIRNGAALAGSAADVLEALSIDTIDIPAAAAIPMPEDPAEAAVWQALGREPQHIDAIGRTAGLSASAVGAVLAILELKGLVRQPAALHYVRTT
jgi:DNA processing protein